jgi:hypothetical protein
MAKQKGETQNLQNQIDEGGEYEIRRSRSVDSNQMDLMVREERMM